MGLGAIAQQAGRFRNDPSIATGTDTNSECAFVVRTGDTRNSRIAGNATPLIVENCVRVGHFKSYGGEAARLSRSDANEKFTRVEPTNTNWLAIAAPDFRGVERQATSAEAFEHIVSIAHAGFSMAQKVAASRCTDLHTGKLGAGVFKNSVLNSAAAQLLAAKIVGINQVTFHEYSGPEAEMFDRANAVVQRRYERAKTQNPPPSVRTLVRSVFDDL